MISFRSVGFSTESDAIFDQKSSKFSKFPEEQQVAIIQGFEDEVQQGADILPKLKEFVARAEESGYTGSKLDRVKFLTRRMEEVMDENSVVFLWGVEYDENIMMLEGTDYTSAVAFFKKKKKELDF